MKEFKAGDEVFNLRKMEWGVLEKRTNAYYPLGFTDGDTFTSVGKYNDVDKFFSLLSYNPFDPDDPKNRDMPIWMQRYHGMRKELQDIRDFLKADENESTYDEVVRALSKARKQTHSLEEVKRKIYAGEMAIENNGNEEIETCLKFLWPNDKAPVPYIFKYYYQHMHENDKWFHGDTIHFRTSILATDLLKLIEAAQAEDAPKTLTLEEVKQAIYNREMAIENNDAETLKKCVKVLWPNDKCLVYGNNNFYCQNKDNENKWDSGRTNPLPFSILATDLVKLIDQSADYAVKPPLGLIPKHIHDTKRKKEILEAMQRYTDAGKSIPVEWLDELRSLSTDTNLNK